MFPFSSCPTAKAIAATIDGAAERAVLIDASEENRGQVLHMNTAARRFLFVNESNPRITDMLVSEDEQDWLSIKRCRVVKKDGTPTRNARNITWADVSDDANHDCGSSSSPPLSSSADNNNNKYLVAYICSKHERVREVVDYAFDPVVTTDEHGIIRTANPAALELFGYTADELSSRSVSILCGGGHASHHDGYIQKYLDTAEKHIVGTRREVTGLKKDGTEFPCELGVQEFDDVSTGLHFFCGYFKDLTQAKEHEAELVERQAKAQGMINASFDSMFEINESGIIQLVNDSACSMFGYSREEFIGSNISMICGGGEAQHHDAHLKRYLESGVKRIIGRKRQVQGRRKDGSEFEVELGVQEVRLDGKDNVYCGFIRDLTQQKKDKRALRKQQQIIHGKFFGSSADEENDDGASAAEEST